MQAQPIIYPTNISKYHGSILPRLNKAGDKTSYQTLIRVNNKNDAKTFKSYELAFNHIQEYNIKHGLVKNIIIDKGDHYEMQLTQGKTMLFDKQDMDILFDIPIHANGHQYDQNDGYWVAQTMTKDRQLIQIHRLIYEKHNGAIPDGLLIDHIDNSYNGGLDNRLQNLRLATYSLNARNSKSKMNKSGISGISVVNGKNDIFWYQGKLYQSKNMKTKEEANQWLSDKQIQVIPEDERLVSNRLQ